MGRRSERVDAATFASPASDWPRQTAGMSSLYTPTIHPRIARRRHQGPVLVSQAAPTGGAITRFNTRLGLGVTVAVGSMWAAYLFAMLALVSLPSAIKSGSLIVIIGWIAQTFLQLVLLPIIIVGQNVQAAASDQRAQSTFDDTEAIIHTNEQIQAHLRAQDEAIVAIMNQLGVAVPPPQTAGADEVASGDA